MFGAACSEDDDLSRTVDVSALSFEDVRTRALAAAVRPGFITHLRQTQSSQENDAYLTESWLDADHRTARIDINGTPDRVFSPEKIAMVSPLDGRYEEALYSFDGLDEPLIGFTLDYLTRIIRDDAEYKGIDEANLDGSAAIAIEVSQERGGDARGMETARIYLDENFLPIQIEIDRGLPGFPKDVLALQLEHIPAASMAADFFSFEQVRQAAATSAEAVLAAARGFDRVYWLGDPYEEMTLQFIDQRELDDGSPALSLDYGLENAGAGGPDGPFPCAQIDQFTADGWERVKFSYTEQTPLVFDDTVVLVSTRCGPPGKNRFDTQAGYEQLVGALEPLMRD